MNKPIKPNITIPESFAENGIKTDFTAEQIQNGFDNLRPEVLNGDNLNKFIDDTYKGLNYSMAAADAINLINEGETLTVVDGKLTSGASGGGLEIGDIGIAPLGIDETQGKRRYLNGQILIQDQYKVFTDKLKNSVALYPSLACTESEWQTTATMTLGGQVGKFVIDDNAGTIRLPKIIMPIQGLTDLSKLGEIVEAGLPNIKGQLWLGDVGDTGLYAEVLNTQDTGGMFYQGKSVSGYDNTSGKKGNLPCYDFSRANSIYKDGSTVQQEQIQYPYFIQVATGAETKEDFENEHLLNIPFFIGYSQYFENAPYNLSWSVGGSTLTRAVHPAYYDALLIELNADIEVGTTQNNYTKRGLPVKLATDSDITDYDFVVNPADETFTLPLLNGSETIPSESINVTDKGEEFTLSRNGYIIVVGEATGANSFISATVNYLGSTSSRNVAGASHRCMTGLGKRGDIVKIFLGNAKINTINFYPAIGNGSLYFYVGEVAQNTNLVNAGRIEEIKANKTDVDGQWVMTKALTLASEVAVNKNTTELTYDLSDYLPNDGYNYEVIFEANALTGSTSGQYMFVRLLTDYVKAMGQGSGVYLCNNRTRSNSYVNMAGNAILPVGNGRSVTVGFYQTSDNFNGSFNLWVDGYRRIGKNV